MKFLFTLNMPPGAADTTHATHQIILDIAGAGALDEVHSFVIRSNGFAYGAHMTFERHGIQKVWKNRGPMIINMAHVGKVVPYYEGGQP